MKDHIFLVVALHWEFRSYSLNLVVIVCCRKGINQVTADKDRRIAECCKKKCRYVY